MSQAKAGSDGLGQLGQDCRVVPGAASDVKYLIANTNVRPCHAASVKTGLAVVDSLFWRKRNDDVLI